MHIALNSLILFKKKRFSFQFNPCYCFKVEEDPQKDEIVSKYASLYAALVDSFWANPWQIQCLTIEHDQLSKEIKNISKVLLLGAGLFSIVSIIYSISNIVHLAS